MHILIYQIAFTAVVLTSEIIYRVFNVHPEITRKLTHTGLCMVALTVPSVTDSISVVLILMGIAYLLLYLSKRFGVFGSLNNVERKTSGDASFIAALFICFSVSVLMKDPSLFYIPVLILALADSAAGLTGVFLKVKRWPGSTWAGRANKSYAGSAVFFFTSFLVIMMVLPAFHQAPSRVLLATSLAIGMVATLFEAFSGKGYDNITVPVVTMLLLILYQAI